jgi:hypothetical protein
MSLIFLIIVLCTLSTALVTMLALLAVGIWRQERAASFAREPAGLCASLARHMLGLYVRCPGEAYSRGSGHVRG